MDNLTNLDSLDVVVTGVTSGAVVFVQESGVTLASATATSDTVTITVDASSLADGAHSWIAFERLNGQDSGATDPLVVTLDRTAPAFSSTPNSNGEVGVLYAYNAETDDDANDPEFSLANAPSNASVDAASGLVNWTPTQSQSGVTTFQILATDAAGNTGSQDISVDVVGLGLVDVVLRATDAQGNAISEVLVGESFLVEMRVRDLRGDALGVAAAYVDFLFDGGVAAVDGSVVFDANFATGRTGTVSSGLIDELGATAVGGLGGGEFLVVTIPMIATSVGFADIRVTAADTDIELVGPGAVSPEDVNFGSLVFDVVPPFRAVDDEFSFDEDAGEQGLTVLSNDQRNDGVGELTIVGVDISDAGVTPIITAQGTLIGYTAPPDFNGEDTFTYRVSDGSGDVSEATVTLLVQSVNDPPTAVDDEFTGDQRVAEDSVNNFLDLLANDEMDPDVDDELTILRVGMPSAGGRVTIGAAGQHVNYTPLANFDGTETFTYVLSDRSDGSGIERTATVTVEVSGTNDPPNAVNDSYAVNEDSDLEDNPLSVLDNDTTEVGETLRITSVGSLENGATAEISEDGTTIFFKPGPNFSGPTAFVYTIDDGRGGMDTARVSVTVIGSNDPPIANDDPSAGDSLSFGRNTGPHTILVLANDSLNGDTSETLTITAVTQGSNNGLVEISDDLKSVRYTPAAGYTGPETFSYTISDGTSTDTATVSVEVLDFDPALISGAVFIDLDEDGVQAGTESPVSGVKLTLTGTDQNGQSVNRVIYSAADGSYVFDNLVPGSYEVTETQPSMLADGSLVVQDESATILNSNAFSITLADGQEATGNLFIEGGRAPQTYGIRDLFHSTRKNTAFATMDAASGQTVAWLQGAWAEGTTVEVTADAGVASYEIRQDGVVMEAVALDIDSPPPAHVVDQSHDASGDEAMLLRLLAPQRPLEARRSLLGGPANSIGASANAAFVAESEGEGEAAAPLAPTHADAVFSQLGQFTHADTDQHDDDDLLLADIVDSM